MGGNVVVKDINGNEIQAVKVDLKQVGRSNVIKQARELFSALNVLHEAKFGSPLWVDSKMLKDAVVFNGSSSFILSDNFTDDEILKVKPTMGDIDIAIPEQYAETLFSLLSGLHGKRVSSNVEFVGQNRTSSSSLGTQINCIFRFLEPVEYLVQVDFEFLPFEETGAPTEWARFSHSSSFEDAKDGVKAVHHKYLIRALVGGVSVRPDIVIATAKSTWDNYKITAASKKGDVARMLKFSVDHGVRVAYQPLLDPNGNEITDNGKIVYKEIPTSSSDYKKTLVEIFKLVFNDVDSKDVNKLWTFKGVVELCGKYLTKSQQKDVAERYFALLWGLKPQRAQELERANPEEDLKVKSGGWNLFKKLTGIKDPAGFEGILQEYYSTYRMNEETLTESVDLDKEFEEISEKLRNAKMADAYKIVAYIQSLGLETEPYSIHRAKGVKYKFGPENAIAIWLENDSVDKYMKGSRLREYTTNFVLFGMYTIVGKAVKHSRSMQAKLAQVKDNDTDEAQRKYVAKVEKAQARLGLSHIKVV